MTVNMEKVNAMKQNNALRESGARSFEEWKQVDAAIQAGDTSGTVPRDSSSPPSIAALAAQIRADNAAYEDALLVVSANLRRPVEQLRAETDEGLLGFDRTKLMQQAADIASPPESTAVEPFTGIAEQYAAAKAKQDADIAAVAAAEAAAKAKDRNYPTQAEINADPLIATKGVSIEARL